METKRTEGIFAFRLVLRRFEAEDVLVLVVQGDTSVVGYRYFHVLSIALLRQLFGRSA